MNEQSESSESSSDEEPTHLNTHSDIRVRRVEETSKDFAGFPASDHGFVGNNHNNGEWKDAYERVLPGHFDSDEGQHVDTFTRNVIKNYATEGVTKQGKPNGYFFITKEQAKDIANEVVQTHLGYDKAKTKQFLDQKFDDMWDYYDVNREQIIDANWTATFMRALCKPVKDIDLQ